MVAIGWRVCDCRGSVSVDVAFYLSLSPSELSAARRVATEATPPPILRALMTNLRAPTPIFASASFTPAILQQRSQPHVPDTAPLPPALDQPPFYGEGDQSNLLFLADARIAQGMLPAGFELATEALGKTPLIVTANRYRENFSIGSNRPGPAYDEMGFAVPVKHRTADGREVQGLYFLELHLNASMPTDVGVQTYGFNKHLATLQINTAAHSETWQVQAPNGSLLGAMTLREPHGLIGGLLGSLAGMGMSLGYDLLSWVTGPVPVLLDRGGTKVLAKIDATVDRVTPLLARDVKLPPLERAGLIRPNQQPIAAFKMHHLSGVLSLPLKP